MKDFWRAIKFASRSRLIFAASITLTFALAGIGLLIPFVYKQFFDIVEQVLTSNGIGGVAPKLGLLTLTYFGLLCLQTILGAAQSYVQATWWYSALSELYLSTYTKLQTLSIDFFDSNSIGKIRERTNQGVQSLVNVVDSFFRNVSVQIVFTVISVIVLFKINTVYGILALTGVPIVFVINFRNKRYFTNFRKKNRKFWEKLGGLWHDSMLNIRIIRSFTSEGQQIGKMKKLLKRTAENGLAVQGALSWMRIQRGVILNLFRVASLTYGVYLISKNQMSLGTFTLAYTYLDRCLTPLNDVSQSIEDIQTSLVDTKLLFEFMDEKPSVTDATEAVALGKAKGDIEFRNVYYSYGSKKVLNGISLKIPRGTTVAFVGKSGVGKTTLMKLILRFYDVTSGQILIDGNNIKNLTQHSLRGNIATVFQDPYLFNDTIKFNIAYGRARASLKKIEEAAELSNADTFIRKLKDGYKTVIGERGVKLSGGEQQRISIARAIIKDAPIIILDEATSSLDSESELLIQDALFNLTQNKTTLIIAHRLSTVMRADLIAVVDKGKITEIGTHKDLVAKKGIYAKLFEIQSGGYLK
jgi:ATP-binding cassette, subfamily B, heavy metal transporter